MAKILIFSNNPQLAAAWTHALLSEHSVNRILNLSAPFQADAVIFDANKLNGDSSLQSIFNRSAVRFLVIGSGFSEQEQVDLMVHGAAGYCEAEEAEELLNRAVACILKGDVWIKRALVPKVIGVLTGQLQGNHRKHLSQEERQNLLRMAASLSSREIEVANMIRQGENNKAIAEAMNISERTVKAHLSSIFRKFDVDDRLRLAIRLKEIDQFH